jgi:hypothetical protein
MRRNTPSTGNPFLPPAFLGATMANRHTVTKRNRRQKSAKRVNYAHQTAVALRKLAEADKEKAK